MENNQKLSGKKYIGTVMGYNTATRKLAVYIPQLMPALPSNSYYETSTPVNSGISITGGVNLSTTIKTSNAAWFLPEKRSYRIPKIGSHVSIYFVDGNVKYGYWSEFSPNDDYDIIPEEKYPLVATLTIGTKTFGINEKDILRISLPGNIGAIYSEDGKTKSVSIKDDNTDYDTMKDQISILNKNNEYLKKRILKTIETSSISKIEGYESSVTDVINASILNTYSEYIGTTISKYLSSASEIYEIDEKEAVVGKMETLFEEASKSTSAKTYYTGKSQAAAFASIESEISKTMISAMKTDYDKPDLLTEYASLISKRLSTTASLRFEYPNFVTVNDGTAESPVNNVYSYIEKSAELFDSVAIADLGLPAPTMKYDGLSWSIFRYWCTDSELKNKLSDTLAISGDLDLFPKFFALRIKPVGNDEYLLDIVGNSDSYYSISKLTVKYGAAGSTLESDAGLTASDLAATDGIYTIRTTDYPSGNEEYYLYIEYSASGGTAIKDRISITAIFR